MTLPANQSDVEDLGEALNRLYMLVKSSQQIQEPDREQLIEQLDILTRIVRPTTGSNDSTLPEGLPQALHHTELLATQQLGVEAFDGSDTRPASDATEPTWDHLARRSQELVAGWEARHPELALSMAKITDTLSKLGI